MSLEDNLKLLKLKPEIVRQIKAAARLKAKELKFKRKVLDRLARQMLVAHYDKDRKPHWDSKKNNAQFRALMAQRHAIHTQLFRLVGEKKDPEFDSP